ncbi:2527_t:CDS:2, partial [Acaulospora morrowiae]
MGFQIFVRGLKGETTTYNDITPQTRIKKIKKMVEEKIGIKASEQRLIFAGKQLEDQNTVGHYNITGMSTLHLVIRLPGGEKRYGPNDDVELTNEPDMITFEDDLDDLRAKMPCGHAIGPKSLTDYCRSLVSEGKFQFFCPYIYPTNNVRCNVEWKYDDIRRLGLLTDDERKYFEFKISESYSFRVLGVRECPQICSKMRGAKEFAFCWYCLHEVKDSSCNNNFCEGVYSRLSILKNAVTKEMYLEYRRFAHVLNVVQLSNMTGTANICHVLAVNNS